MCCLWTTLVFLGPRAGILIWWLAAPARWQLTFATWVWPLLGFLFLPWTTLMYVAIAPGGIYGLSWLWIGLAVVADIAMYAGGGYGNRRRMPGYTGN
jgi:hypothetical protein